MVGKTLGHYEILEPLGKGGMGEVYRARDTKLDRDVAIKVLPDDLAADADRLARFEREAKLLAALSHANIGAIHGLEESNGVRFLVLELIEGETLERRLMKGAIPVSEALDIARQIAEALEAAHDAGIIHRDVKPANVLLTPKGGVKVLDFGIAKNTVLDVNVEAADQATSLTMDGTLMGTPPYMSPEQIRGEEADKRADIWAFGCVLYEMLAGRGAFVRETVADTLAAVLDAEPDWEAVPGSIPPEVGSLLRRCLRKDTNRRLRDIGDARIEIEETVSDPLVVDLRALVAEARTGQQVAAEAPAVHAGELRGSWLPWGLFVAATLLAVALGVQLNRANFAAQLPVSRWSLVPEDGQLLARGGTGRYLALSPDGTNLVYGAGTREPQLYLRPANLLTSTPIPETELASHPFFSPDGNWIGFFVERRLMRVPVNGGPAMLVCETPSNPRGATWIDDDHIVFATDSEGVFTVPSAGGEPTLVVPLGPDDPPGLFRWPAKLPGGGSVLITVFESSLSSAAVGVLDLETGDQRIIAQPGTQPVYASSGHVVFARAGNLFAIPFDPDTSVPTGDPLPLPEGVLVFSGGAANYDISEEGSLAYVPGGEALGNNELAWLDDSGSLEPVTDERGAFFTPRISPNGKWLTVSLNEGDESDLWVFDLEREGSPTKLTLEGRNWAPVWSHDSEWVFFASDRGGDFDVHKKRPDFSGAAQLVLDRNGDQYPESLTDESETLVFTDFSETNRELWVVGLDEPENAARLIESETNTYLGRISPDGEWLAYVSDESGQYEVYVGPFLRDGGRQKVSDGGGTQPVWSRDGRELFYQRGFGNLVGALTFGMRTLVGVDVTLGSNLALGDSRDVREVPGQGSGVAINEFLHTYDVRSDGSGFVVVLPNAELVPDTINVVLNWFEELKQRVPTGRQP